MDTVVLKFGGSSVADNIKLNVVAEKIKSFYEENKKVVVVVSAQGKTTDGLIKEAMSLSSVPNERELDVLLSTGEQISMAKVAILLNRLGMPAISLTGWQAGIYTNNTNQDAIIEDIDTSRIEKELEQGKIVIVAGFQGINPNMDITTLGRGGSDTTAVALAAKLKASKCYIFSDVDGVYTADPRQTKVARKINTLSYTEMLDIADEGAKVLHNRCVEIAEKYKVLIETRSTFNSNIGTIINEKIEESAVKSIVKNDNFVLVNFKGPLYCKQNIMDICLTLLENGIALNTIINNSTDKLDINFTIHLNNFNKLQHLLTTELDTFESTITDISRISLIGYGIKNNKEILEKTLDIFKLYNINMLSLQIDETKLSIMTKERAPEELLNKLHQKLIV